jgi:alkanesulfonate monooxygenase SsuD/methylene tetrahydromethanopterin reductase-like flavin-dependent oxidoreductase (luciferase family)
MVTFSLALDMRPAPGSPPRPAHYDRLMELARRAEQLGYGTIWASEQHGVDDGYLPAPLLALSAFARETTTIELASGVILLPLMQPRRVAQEAGLLDVLSHGRLTLGVGAGHHPHEFQIFERDLRDRARLMDEGIAYLREALSTGMAPDGYPINVPPVQRRVPIMVGGLARPAVDRAARLGDGHVSYAHVDPDELLPKLWAEQIEPAMARHGRERGSFRLAMNTTVWPSESWEREWREHVGHAFAYQQRRYAEWAGDGPLPDGLTNPSGNLDELRERMLIGTPREVADRLAAIHDAYPFDEIVIWPALPGVPEELAEQCMETFAREVAPAIDRTTTTQGAQP